MSPWFRSFVQSDLIRTWPLEQSCAFSQKHATGRNICSNSKDLVETKTGCAITPVYISKFWTTPGNSGQNCLPLATRLRLNGNLKWRSAVDRICSHAAVFPSEY